MYSLNCKGKLLDLSTPKVMGVLNVTPDSFYDGNRYTSTEQILQQVSKMLEEGADIIDIGGMSSRPGAAIVSVAEELKRVIPAVEIISKHYPDAIISIDTIQSEVAKQGIAAGGHIINDISAGQFDEKLFQTIGELGVPYMLMHMQGTPKTMQNNPDYKDVVLQIIDFLVQQVAELRQYGVKDIVIDPGFGFGKSLAHNYQILGQLHNLKILELPILVGLSRKSMIYKVLKSTPAEALNGTTALNMLALQNGANILRVHDVKAAVETIQLWQTYAAINR